MKEGKEIFQLILKTKFNILSKLLQYKLEEDKKLKKENGFVIY